MSWELCTSGAALLKAGIHANATLKAYPSDVLYDMSEGWLALITNLSLSGAPLLPEIKQAVAEILSSHIAMSIIQYDPTGYLTREADMLMNNNYDIVARGLKALDGKSNTLKTP